MVTVVGEEDEDDNSEETRCKGRTKKWEAIEGAEMSCPEEFLGGVADTEDTGNGTCNYRLWSSVRTVEHWEARGGGQDHGRFD